jgi:hypothetical protein
MHSEWLKIMLEEIARKREQAERDLEEERRRVAERGAASGKSPPAKARGTPRTRS